jgi:hypothetical protein
MQAAVLSASCGETSEAIGHLHLVLKLETQLQALSIKPRCLGHVVAVKGVVAETMKSRGEAPDGEPQRRVRSRLEPAERSTEIAVVSLKPVSAPAACGLRMRRSMVRACSR